MKQLTIILPAHDEETSLPLAVETIHRILELNDIMFDILIVNDGSGDKTWQIIERLSRTYDNVDGISFSRNFGKEAAIYAGLKNAKGDAVIVMDADLQHPPEAIVAMYHKWLEGYQVVNGVKRSRGKEGLLYKLSVKSFYKMISNSIGIDMSKSSDFKLLDRVVVDEIAALPERHLFFRGLSAWVGYKTATVEFDVQERVAGNSKWSVVMLAKYAINNLTSFSTAPMQLVTLFGTLFFAFALVLGIQTLVRFFSGGSLSEFTTVILLILILGAVMMVSLGIIGIYIAKIYEGTQRRPRYIVTERTHPFSELEAAMNRTWESDRIDIE